MSDTAIKKIAKELTHIFWEGLGQAVHHGSLALGANKLINHFGNIPGFGWLPASVNKIMAWSISELATRPLTPYIDTAWNKITPIIEGFATPIVEASIKPALQALAEKNLIALGPMNITANTTTHSSWWGMLNPNAMIDGAGNATNWLINYPRQELSNWWHGTATAAPVTPDMWDKAAQYAPVVGQTVVDSFGKVFDAVSYATPSRASNFIQDISDLTGLPYLATFSVLCGMGALSLLGLKYLCCGVNNTNTNTNNNNASGNVTNNYIGIAPNMVPGFNAANNAGAPPPANNGAAAAPAALPPAAVRQP